MSVPPARLALLRRLAIACTVLVLAITTLSAFIRLTRAGVGCTPWPACYEQRAALSADALAARDGPAVAAARIAHRVAASTALVLVIVLLMRSLAQQPPLRTQGRWALALLALCLFLAALGRAGGDSRSLPVVVGNLAGGFALLAACVRMVQACGAAVPGVPLPLRPWVVAAFALLCAQVGLGAAVSGSHLANGCSASTLCNVHRAGAVALLAILLPLGIVGWRAGLRVAAAVAALAVVQATLGWLLVAQDAPLAVALAHNVVAALLFAAVPASLPAKAS